MEKILTDNLFQDIEEEIDAMYDIKAAFNSGAAMMKNVRENKTTVDFLVGIKNKINVEEIDSIEYKTQCVSRTEEHEIMD